MSITQEIDLNLIPSSAPVIVHLNQYDEGKGRIIAHLYNGSQPYVPGVNATVKVQGTKPDKHAFQYWCDIDGSTVTVDVNVQMTAVAGLVPTQLIVNETSGITGSFAFQLDVQASTLPSNIDVSETDLPILTEEAQEAARRAVQAAASAEESAEEAAGWSANPPYIGENLHWYVYDTETEQFVDSGVVAEGQDGAPGNKWYKGTTISGESSTPTVFPSSGIALAYHNDFYLNATEGSIYHCENPGDASTATWVYDFKLSGGGGGVTNYNDLTNKPKVGGVELTGNKTIADLGGVQSFNGRSGSILPVAGDYKSNQIILSSIMHIGGGTQDDVQEALEALNDKDAGGSTITVTTAEVTLRGKNVTLSDGVNTWTKQFDNAGKAIFTSIMSTGALSVTASDGTETASGTINAPYFGNYTCPIAFFEAVVTVYGGTGMLGGCPVVAKKDGVVVASGVLSNIFGQPSEYVFHLNQPGTYTFEVTNDWRTFASNPATYSVSGTYNTTVNGFETDVVVYTSSTEFKGKDVTVTCAGVPTSTIRLDASLGSAVYKALMPGTYTFSLTYQGTVYTTSAVVTVTDTQISAPPLALWTATLAITTSSSSLYGKTITIKKGSTVVGTTAFSAQGSATYTVHETGTYTCECEGYSGSATVSAETTYNVTINSNNVTITTDATVLESETLTATNGVDTETATITNGVAGFNLAAGEWEVAGIPITVVDGQTYTKQIVVFAYHYSENDSNPDSGDYPSGYDNYGWTPFAMDLSTGVPNYGSWDASGTNADKLAWFYPKSCMVKYDGTVDYYLDENDETKKSDGVTASDVANSSYAGNAMIEWGQDGRRIYWKIVADSGNDGWTFIVANAEVLGLKPWNHYDINGKPNMHWYEAKYFGSSDGTRLRSISGGSNYVNNAGTTEISLAEANNLTTNKLWTTGTFVDYMFFALASTLITKNLNCQAALGAGCSASGNTSAIGQGTMNGQGRFYGKSNGTEGVKVFGVENPYGNIWRRIRGLINVNGSYRIKMTYDQTDGSTTDGYNTDGSGYINAGSIGTTAAWVYPKHDIVRDNCILAQTNGGSETTYYCDATYLAASGTLYAFLGGSWSNAGSVGVFCVRLNDAASATSAGFGAALSLKPLAQ